MPELPEVETIVRNVRPRLQGRRVVAFATRWKKNAVPNSSAVRAGLIGRTIVEVGRRAKLIVFTLDDGGHLLIHLRMSGRFEWAADHAKPPGHVRASWTLDDGDRLLFCDARKFGRMTYTRDFAAATAGLGVEPLARGFTPRLLAHLLARRSRQLKPLLLDQTVVAGLGNIYADESLHLAGLHPLRSSASLTGDEVRRLHGAIRQILRKAIRYHGTSIDWMYPGGRMQNCLAVYGRGGAPCRACGTAIDRLIVGQRSTHICPRCQPAVGTR